MNSQRPNSQNGRRLTASGGVRDPQEAIEALTGGAASREGALAALRLLVRVLRANDAPSKSS